MAGNKLKEINLFDAIKQMKEISLNGGTFSFKFRKWDRQRRKGGDIVEVRRARLRPKASDEDVKHASYKLFYQDLDAELPRVCWQPLIIEFNGQPTTLN